MTRRFEVLAMLGLAILLGGMTGDGCATTGVQLPALTRPAPDLTAEVDPANPRAVTFRGNAASYPDAMTVNWSFGDGSAVTRLPVASGLSLTHTYVRSGSVLVEMHLFNAANRRIGSGMLALEIGGSTQPGDVDDDVDTNTPPDSNTNDDAPPSSTLEDIPPNPFGHPRVLMTTNLGQFLLELNQATAPETVANFLQYVDEGHYDNIVFHRVVPDFVVQAGAFRSNGPGANPRLREIPADDPIDSEANRGLSNLRGTIAMALRGTDANSATDQFFINLVDNTNLDNGPPPFTVFGNVVAGMDTIDRIAAVETGSATVQTLSSGTVVFQDVPVDDVTVLSADRFNG